MVNVIGLGYIGLPTALMMASHGVEVVGTNHSQGKVDMLKAGKQPSKRQALTSCSRPRWMAGLSSQLSIR